MTGSRLISIRRADKKVGNFQLFFCPLTVTARSSITHSYKLFIYLFYFHFIYSWLKITHLHKKKSLYSLYSNNIELVDVSSFTEQEMQSFPNQFFKSMWTSWQTHTHTHICTHIHQSTTPGNASIPVQWVFWCSL